MLRRIFTIILCLFSFFSLSQVFIGTGGTIQNAGQETYFNLPVSGLAQSQLDNDFGISEVCITISHPTVEELQVYLQSPGGTLVQLSEGSSCKGVDYAGTCFNNAAATSVSLASAPYSGSYRPIGFLGRINNGQTGNGTWSLIVKDYLAFVNAGNVVTWSISFSTSPVPAVGFTSSKLPIVVINTNNQQVVDTDILVDFGVIYKGVGQTNYLSDPFNDYNDKAKMRLRGSSTRIFEKKAFAIETCDAAGVDASVSLLGMPAESDWVLLAMYQDKSLLRVPLTYDLSRQMGRYASRFKLVEVVVNNEYRGVYALMEKLKRDQNRINISKLSPNENAGPAVTGGYIFKIDRTDEPGWTSLLPGEASGGKHFYYQYVYPKDSITTQQKDYIKAFVDSFETVIASSYYSDPWIGYQKYVGIESLVDYFILNEISKNVDAYRLSTYFYKDKINKGGKMHIGPVWDFDLAWHNCNYGNSFDPTGWEYQLTDTIYSTPTWWNRLMQDTNFQNVLYCRWTQLRQTVLSSNHLYAYIDSAALALDGAQQRNFTQWPILGAYIHPNPQNQVNASFHEEIEDLKKWIAARVAWMDVAIAGHCPLINIQELDNENRVALYPNPFLSVTTFELHLTRPAEVMLKIFDVMGKERAVLIEEFLPSGEFKIAYDRASVASGIYFYQLHVGETSKTGKIIIE